MEVKTLAVLIFSAAIALGCAKQGATNALIQEAIKSCEPNGGLVVINNPLYEGRLSHVGTSAHVLPVEPLVAV